ncbi:MAG: WD40 repeat domain-containing protein [Opitutus sp.]|nr:WD40 repeat domain-containing protein [Opitutus sp.]
MQLTKHWAAQLDDYAIDLAWSPDGATLAAASSAGPVALFAAADGKRGPELPRHDQGTNCLAWAPTTVGGALRPDSSPQAESGHKAPPTVLATGGQDGAVKFWDITAGQHTATAALGRDWVDHLAWVGRVIPSAPPSAVETERRVKDNPPYLFAATGRVLHALRPDGSIAHAFKPAPKTITSVAAQPGGGCVAAAYFGGVCLWDADDFIAQKEFPYANGIHALVWSPDSKWLVSGNQDPSVHLWIPEKDTELHMSGYEGKVKFLSFDHTSRWLATSGGRDCCVWDCTGDGPEGREPVMLPHDAPICAVKFQNAHGLLATASADGVVQLWSPDRAKPLRATVKMPSAATKLAWSPDDTLLAIGSEKGAVYVLKCEA